MAAIATDVSAFLSGELEPFWPHFVLLSVSIVSSFAVAAGIILESPKYSESIHRIANKLVIGGVAVEALCTIGLFVFDEGISGAQQSRIAELQKSNNFLLAQGQEAEAFASRARRDAAKANEHAAQLEKEAAEAQLALQRFKAPRWLTQLQQDALVDTMRPFAPQEYALSAGEGQEAENLLCLLDSLLQRAGWVKVEHFGALAVDTSCGAAGVNSISGVQIRVPAGTLYTPGHGANAAATELGRLLNAFDIAAFPAFDPKNIPKANTINLMVGMKP